MLGHLKYQKKKKFLLANCPLPLKKQRYLNHLRHHYQRIFINILLITIWIAQLLGQQRRALRVPLRRLGRPNARPRMDGFCALRGPGWKLWSSWHVPVVLGNFYASRIPGILNYMYFIFSFKSLSWLETTNVMFQNLNRENVLNKKIIFNMFTFTGRVTHLFWWRCTIDFGK